MNKSRSDGSLLKHFSSSRGPPSSCVSTADFQIRRRPSLTGMKRPLLETTDRELLKWRKSNDGTPILANSSTPTSFTGPDKVAELPLLSLAKFARSYSENHAAVIKRACNLVELPNLTADRRQALALPTLKCGKKHQDLNTISCETLARLIRGEFRERVESYRIIDARYIYEYKGGHIVGAENFGAWDETAFFNEFLPQHLEAKSIDDLSHLTMSPTKILSSLTSLTAATPTGKEKQSILIFHCEFSSQRGPALMRELRKRDRMVNNSSYPALHYPEMYLLHNGYKEFWEKYPELCEPKAYQTMKDSAFSVEEKMFRKKSKSWTAPGATVARTGASVSRLFKF